MTTQLYSPPQGSYDQPFTWAFDCSIFANGSNPLGSSIYLLGGYGDFLLRRIVGMNRILAADGTGKFQISRKSRNVYLTSDPIQAPNSTELAIAPEELYLETGKIWFDLYGIELPDAPLTAQLAFQGVRRQKGIGLRPGYKFFPKTFTYQVQGNITQVAPAGPFVTNTKVVDYDFELYQIIVLQVPYQVAECGNEDGIAMTVTGVNGASGNLILASPAPPTTHNQPLTVTVNGTTITVNYATNNGGFYISTTAQVVAAINAAAGSFAFAQVGPAAFSLPDSPLTYEFGPETPTIVTSPVSSLMVFDSNRVAISNMPILDIFYNGGPGSPYENGALVPPLYYPVNSTIEIDFYSQITSAADLPTSVIVYLVGRQLIPC